MKRYWKNIKLFGSIWTNTKDLKNTELNALPVYYENL